MSESVSYSITNELNLRNRLRALFVRMMIPQFYIIFTLIIIFLYFFTDPSNALYVILFLFAVAFFGTLRKISIAKAMQAKDMQFIFESEKLIMDVPGSSKGEIAKAFIKYVQFKKSYVLVYMKAGFQPIFTTPEENEGLKKFLHEHGYTIR